MPLVLLLWVLQALVVGARKATGDDEKIITHLLQALKEAKGKETNADLEFQCTTTQKSSASKAAKKKAIAKKGNGSASGSSDGTEWTDSEKDWWTE